MSESLKDQLLKAGFAESAKSDARPSAKRRRSRRRAASGASANERPAARDARSSGPRSAAAQAKLQDSSAAAERKALKQRIRALIEAAEVAAWRGDMPFRYLLGGRVRELHVNETVRQGLVDGKLGITRLNGRTCVVPNDTIDAIVELNPGWARMQPAADRTLDSLDERYSDYVVPDDLQW